MKKRLVTLMTILIMSISLSACNFSVGTSSSKDDYDSLFTDAAAEKGSTYKTSEVGYKYSLDNGYGEMMVHVDTSNGHSFEVMNENPTGFKIKDSDGNDILYAICMDQDQYADYTSYCDHVNKVNGRDFLVRENGDGSIDYCSYMADCGLNVGLVMEVTDGNEDNFRLVAFRGEPLEGSSSDVYYYQGSYDDFIDEDFEDDDLETDGANNDLDKASSGSNSLTTTTLSSDIQEVLDDLATDYTKVNWGVQYSIFEDHPAVVFSVTPCMVFDNNMLVVAITNLYDTDLAISANASALDADGNIIGDLFIYEPCIGASNTFITTIDCGDNAPDGRIHWDECEVRESYSKYAPWEADYAGKGNPDDGYLTIDYSFSTVNGEACENAAVTILLLDENGFVTGIGSDYITDISANAKYDGSVDIYGDEAILALSKNVAIFADPVVAE